MNYNNKYPNLIIHEGIGTFISGDIEFEASFEIIHYPQHTIINAQPKISFDFDKIFKSQNLWDFHGLIEHNICVSGQDLLCTNASNSNFTFEPLKEMKFGYTSMTNFAHAQFPLVGLYDGQIKIDHDNWQFATSGIIQETPLIKTKSELWNLPLEGNTLLLKNIKGASIKDFQTKANNIVLLLSLAVGNTVTFNRQLFYQNDKLMVEIWRRKPDYHFGARQCIPFFELNSFLEKSLSNFEKWSKDKRDTYYSVVNFINSSSKGFLEDRLLRLCIAWESLTNKWLSKKNFTNFNKDLNPFKKYLKEVIDKFELPENHDKEFIKDRILMALNWESLFNSLMKLMDQYNLDHDKLKLDLEKLIKIRNDIAHSGQFKKKYPKKYLADLIFYNKVGLRVLLLTELGYDGLIEFKQDGWKTLIKIGELYKKTPSP